MYTPEIVAIQNSEMFSNASQWTVLKDFILSKISHTQKNKYLMLSLIYGNKTNELKVEWDY